VIICGDYISIIYDSIIFFNPHKQMKKLFFLVALAVAATQFAQAQKVFPMLTCETLNDKKVVIPADTKGKRTVICLAMSPKAEKALRAWNNPLYNSLIGNGMGGLMGGRMYDANLCFVGMLKGVAKLGLNEAKKQSREKVEKKQHDNFMVSDDDVRALMKALDITDASEPHFFVLDADGKIIYHTSGEYQDKKLDAITEQLL
jgi:hypothetical protein